MKWERLLGNGTEPVVRGRIVAQIFNLLYRRFAIGCAWRAPRCTYFWRQQNAILRYAPEFALVRTKGLNPESDVWILNSLEGAV
jgi:hypothetical protein